MCNSPVAIGLKLREETSRLSVEVDEVYEARFGERWSHKRVTDWLCLSRWAGLFCGQFAIVWNPSTWIMVMGNIDAALEGCSFCTCLQRETFLNIV